MNRVVHFEIQADDVERAKKFYQAALGWKIEPIMNKEKDGMNYWSITTGQEGEPGINGGMYERPSDDDQSYLYDCTVAVADLDQAVEAVKKNGGAVIKEKMEIPTVGFFATVKDTEGNRFSLIQPTNWSPK